MGFINTNETFQRISLRCYFLCTLDHCTLYRICSCNSHSPWTSTSLRKQLWENYVRLFFVIPLAKITIEMMILFGSIMWKLELSKRDREMYVRVHRMMNLLHNGVESFLSILVFVFVRFMSYSKHSNWRWILKLKSNFGCLFTFCYSAGANLLKTKLQTCNLQIGQSIFTNMQISFDWIGPIQIAKSK